MSITHWIGVLFRNGIPAQKALTKCHFMHERMIGRMVVMQLGSIAISFVHLVFNSLSQTQTQCHRIWKRTLKI